MRDTAHLSEIEECIYSRLIDTYYSRERCLPADEVQCCRLVRATSKQARAAVASVLREFFALQDDGWHQKRCDEELARYAEKSTKAAHSASVRWSERNANAMRTHSEGNANQNQEPEPVTKNQKKTPSALRAPGSVRPEVWESWTRYKGKQKAETANLQAKHLDEWAAQGLDPNAIIETSIRNGWIGLFPPDRSSPQSASDKRAVVAAGHFKDTHEPVIRDITADVKRVA
jgi:uncharacterized protein YdaU (DUF1376 family)